MVWHPSVNSSVSVGVVGPTIICQEAQEVSRTCASGIGQTDLGMSCEPPPAPLSLRQWEPGECCFGETPMDERAFVGVEVFLLPG